MLFSIMACVLSFIVANTCTTNISSFDYLYVFSEALFIICKDLSLSNSTSILSIYLKLVLVFLIVYTICISFIVQW